MAQKVKARIKGFHEVLTDAINHYMDKGWTSEKDLISWNSKLRNAAIRETQSPDIVRAHLTQVYRTLVIDGKLERKFKGPESFNISKIKPELRGLLDAKIRMSVNLIKLNREENIEATMRRFNGWVSSVPPSGVSQIDKVEVKRDISKGLKEQSYEHRRLAIDQGHKLAENIKYVYAVQTGAIALRWHSDWRRQGYNYRPKHKERDTKIYLLRDNWASEKGLIKPVNGYYDEITAAGEEVYCSCTVVPIYSPRDLPDEYLTEKGKNELNRN